MTYPPTPEQGGVHPPPPDPPIEAYQPPPAPFPPPAAPWPAPQHYRPPEARHHPAPYQPATPQQRRPDGPPYGYGAPVDPYRLGPGTDGLAVAALVVSIVSVLGLCGLGIGGVLGVVGAILGHVARRRIRQSGQQGDGMALAGIVVGWIVTGITVLGGIFFAVMLAVDS